MAFVHGKSSVFKLDNASGSSNFAAKGAHRLKIALALGKLDRGSTADSSFVDLMDVKEGVVQHYTRQTEFAVLEETFARRTFDESGDYNGVVTQESGGLTSVTGNLNLVGSGFTLDSDRVDGGKL